MSTCLRAKLRWDELTKVHAWWNGTLSNAVGAVHVIGSVLKLAVPMNSGAIWHVVKDVHDELVTAIDLDQRPWELPCMNLSKETSYHFHGYTLTVDDEHRSLEAVGGTGHFFNDPFVISSGGGACDTECGVKKEGRIGSDIVCAVLFESQT